MTYTFEPPAPVALPVVGQQATFPARRVYCVGRNYAEHAREMGFTGREPPFFFLKPADAIVTVSDGATGAMPYPPLTQNLHHEIELVVAIGKGGKNVAAADAMGHIFGYAVGLDMTRRDLQLAQRDAGRPWDIGKGFDHSAPMGPITPAAQAPGIESAAIWVKVNDRVRQQSRVSSLIWRIAEIIEHISAAWELQPGDLIMTGTPEGVGPVAQGDLMVGGIDGLGELRVKVV
ncbi:MAG: fumarylacetoacetate hydrolase family protein [Hydrogenophaga sp.]|uniref:fumarylacetoacetate hydrolase family protein n=1 Tax=Hydrogenophaga sp. TaxID=1904254 RepID=UPI0025BDABB0|nr:fumarylacetoacetate hydrolase family protein [Hydrogenophaga sp.]MBU7573354.1 fumarylacetoacetate hydrolase family protein [Hydrogenophaga sp.]